MAGANYAHCDLEPCLLPDGSTKVFYDADTDIPEGTVILHAECDAARLAAAEQRGRQQAIADLRNHDLEFGCRDASWAADYLEAQTKENTDA